VLAGRRILLIEEDDATRTRLTRVLSDAHAEVHTAASLVGGLRAFRTLGADLVVTNSFVDASDAQHTLQRLHAVGRRPIIAHTDRAELRDALHALGFAHVLIKPAHDVEVVAAIIGALETWR
jgi:DNA-binding response OmpR family regulator